MSSLTLLVLAHPADPRLKMLQALPDDTCIVAGDRIEAFASAAAEGDAILSWFTSRELLEAVWAIAPRVRWVHCGTAGVDGILFPALAESAVPLSNARGVFSAALGEFVIAAILFVAKDLRRMVRAQAAGVWDPFDIEMVQGRTVGIVGYGDIGRVVAQRARALGMKIIALRRRHELFRDDPYVERTFPLDARKELLALSDVVVAAAPLTPETRGLIGESELRAMRRSAVLINVGRGPVVDEPALIRALEENRIRGAALDVFEREPLPAGHPFFRLDNVLLSPHCADHTADWLERSMQCFLDNFRRFQQGLPLENVVDKKAGY